MFSQGKKFSSANEIKLFQEQKLKEQLEYLEANSLFYRTLFQKNSIRPDKIRQIEDLSLFPFTDKEDLQKQNTDFLCISKDKIAEYFTTSGTLGEPVLFPLSESDLQRLAYNEFLSFEMIGAKRGDTALLTVTSDRCFMAGNAYSAGARKAGITLIKTGPGLPEYQWATILKLKPTLLIAVPSFILKLIEYADKNGIDYKNSSIKKALCVGEPLRTNNLNDNALAKSIISKWPLQLFSTYASTEMSTAFTECEYGKGGHLNPELIIVECLDTEQKPVPAGESGEITITTLGVEAMPLLRFRTGDIATLHYETCTCGRPGVRVGTILGRNKQMIKYKGTTIYPEAIRQTLHSLQSVKDYYIEANSDQFGMDEVIIHLSVRDHSVSAEKEIADAFRSHLRIVPKLCFRSSSEILSAKSNTKSRKPVDFVDNRKQN